MASREFLKILSSARLGDAFSQQKVAEAYLTGAFKTPIQPSNAMIWLEKSYLSFKNQFADVQSLKNPEVISLLSQLAKIPLAQIVGTPAFQFGWKSFWQLAESSTDSNTTIAAKWQLVDLLINPNNLEAQTQLSDWLKKKPAISFASFTDKFSSLDLKSAQKIALQYLQELADGGTHLADQAKELLIRLQPKNEALSSLWSVWLESQNEDALLQAAELGLTAAKLTLGLRLAQLDGGEVENKFNASLKKAAHWLELAAKDGDRNAWYALGEIYRRPQFSGYSAVESDRCFDRAADLGHAQAQLRKGANLWRKREKAEEKVRGLQASYWVWQASQQGVDEAKKLLSKILVSCPDPRKNDWYLLAQYADHAINYHAEHKLDLDWLMLCHRIVIANQFNLSKAELLLSEISQLQHEHCVVVDIRWELPKILPRLIQIETTQQRRALLMAGKVFASSDMEIEGNLRQRRYRFDQVTGWLSTTFSKNLKSQTDTELA
jgi:TPR repeat protein